MVEVVGQIVAGVLVKAIAETGRRLGTAVWGASGRRVRQDTEIARWFDTYQLADTSFEVPETPPGVAPEALAEVLGGDEFQAVLHELLAVRLTDSPDTAAEQVRITAGLTVGVAFSNVDTSQLAMALFDYFDAEICALVGRLEGAEPQLLAQVRNEAFAARMIATLHAIERHTAALSARPDTATDNDFLTRYRRHLIEHHGRLDPPDFERRRRVPINDLYVPPTINQITEEQPDRPPREIDLWQLDREIDRTVLLGDPGGGKTTAAHVLLHHHATGSANEPMAGSRTKTPFLVVLREFATRMPPERSVVGFIEHKLETFYQCPPPPGLVTRLLLSGNALVVFDGLDELVDTSRRAEVTAIVERFCTEYPLTRVLVTSRKVGYDQARLDDRQFVRYRIGSFQDEHVGEYVRKWFAQEEGIDADSWADSFVSESASVPDLRSNPLMLALMCIIYRGEGSIPRNRPEVYEQCANLLFHKWDARRSIHIELRARHLVEPALRYLAYWLFSRDEAQTAVTERELVIKATDFLYERGFETTEEAREAAREFIKFCRGRMWVFSDAGTTASGEALFTFTHRTFLEYFAANHLAVICDTPERLAKMLAPHVARQEWEVVAELAAQIKDHSSDRGAERLFLTLLHERRRRSTQGRGNVLQFLARCLKSMDPPPRTIRKLTRTVLDHLFAGNPQQSERYQPLSLLVENCINCKEIVKDELATRISTMIESVDSITRRYGLQLAAWPWLGSFVNRGGYRPDRTLYNFWRNFTHESLHKYRMATIEASTDDSGLLLAALDHQLITLKQILPTDGGLDSLHRGHQTTIFDIEFASYLAMRIGNLIDGCHQSSIFRDGGSSADAVTEFEAIGRHLTTCARFPRIVDPDRHFRGIVFSERDQQKTSELLKLANPLAYLGATFTLFTLAEVALDKTLQDDYRQRLGPLADTYPYILRRWETDTGDPLPDLPVPEDFQSVFRSWANGDIDFAHLTKKDHK